MSYSNNPYLPKARMKARNDVVWGRLGVSQAANKYGVHRTTIWRWIKKTKDLKIYGNSFIWTKSSTPRTHPRRLKPEVTDKIIELRKKLRRCSPIIHAHLKELGIKVSLSSVERTIKRRGLTRKRKQLKDYKPFPRPKADYPGALVEVDTIHFVRTNYGRFYIYAVIDVFSRLGYAEYKPHLSGRESLKVVLNAQKYFGFKFETVQTDNGGEFPPALGYALRKLKIKFRHSRIRKPNDNAHVERFIRTIQEESLSGRLEEKCIPNKLQRYIEYYNHKRFHLGINCQTPAEYVAKVKK